MRTRRRILSRKVLSKWNPRGRYQEDWKGMFPRLLSREKPVRHSSGLRETSLGRQGVNPVTVGEVSKASQSVRRPTWERDQRHLVTQGKDTIASHTLLVSRESAEQENPRNALTVEKVLLINRNLIDTIESTQEINPISASTVGKASL